MVVTLATSQLPNELEQVPFAMNFAVKPVYVLSEISSEEIQKRLGYNPELQMNDSSDLSISLGTSTCTVDGSVPTGSFSTDSSPDTQADD